METTFDALLNKRVWLEQPAKGYRVSVDTVLLAAACPAVAGQKILDMGCGVGSAMLCVAARVLDLSPVGIDIQPELIAIARRNIDKNNLTISARAEVADVASFTETGFDQIVMNPPFHEETRHSVSGNAMKRTANAEKNGDLAIWLAAAARALTDEGTLTVIHRADREGEIIDKAAAYFGTIDILPVISRPEIPSKRVIMRLRKTGQGAVPKLRRCKGFLLYGPDNRYNEGAEAVIRHAGGIEFAENVS